MGLCGFSGCADFDPYAVDFRVLSEDAERHIGREERGAGGLPVAYRSGGEPETSFVLSPVVREKRLHQFRFGRDLPLPH